MEISGVGKSPNSSLSFRYNANNEELEELFHVCEDDPPTPQCEPPPIPLENASPKRGERSSSIIDKYFKSIRTEKPVEKSEDVKPAESKQEEPKPPKEVSSSPMKEYLNRLGKRSTPDVTPDVKEGTNETWKIFHDFKFKIAQAVEDMKTRSLEETKEKSIPRENSMSDSEENSATKDIDQQSVGDTDNQVSSLDSSIQNLSDITQPLTAKATERDPSLPVDNKHHSDSSDDTHKNLAVYNEMAEVRRDVLSDSCLLEVESGIEALEDTIDGFGDIHSVDPQLSDKKPLDTNPTPPPLVSPNFGPPPSNSNLKPAKSSKTNYFCNYSMYFLTFLIFMSFFLFPRSNIWNGFVLGLWVFCFTSSLKSWLLDNYFSEVEPTSSLLQLKRSSAMPTTYTIPSVKEHRPIKKYEGWINHYRFPDYDPNTYHINKTTTAFMKLEGCNLRISYTTTKVPKRELWDEKLDKVAFYQHRLYNLTGARVILLPKGLVKRRQWSKKYPICIILNDKETIQVLEKENSASEKKAAETPSEKKKEHPHHEMETETGTSPEKKKKFVWRRREKSISHSDGETGKEGLRHRLVRKMHRDKKTDSVATATEPVETQSQSQVQTEKTVYLDDSMSVHEHEIELTSKSATSTKDENDDEFDDHELSKIKEFLEETDMEVGADGMCEGEWSLHVKHSNEKKHSPLYLFARTGRDKHEWYRRLIIAINDANAASAENSAAEEKTANTESGQDSKDNIEMAIYKITEKETVAFAKSSNKTMDGMTEGGGVTFSTMSQPIPPETDYEKTFWPYLLKIIQSHEMTFKQTSEAAVMCQIEPSPRERSKNKKKRKDNKNSSMDCSCRMLPAEVTWLNTLLARIAYDLMRDPVMITRLQNRIQRKLNTLKLPSFMSPLLVTELSLAGACPLVERVLAPAWDARGVWLDADLRYDGGAYIAILTQINLLKLKEKNITLEDQMLVATETGLDADMKGNASGGMYADQSLRSRKPAIYDSEVEDSAESSSDDESPPVQPVDSNETVNFTETGSTNNAPVQESGTSSKKKFLRMVDKIATNKYFQQVTDYKYVKRAMEGLSNTDIKLHLEVHALEGRLAINLPPPPHDRVWLGFRTNPQLVLKARPAVGARTLRFAHITNWIEQKLSKEFEKVLVLPNMEDIIVDIMTPTPVKFE